MLGWLLGAPVARVGWALHAKRPCEPRCWRFLVDDAILRLGRACPAKPRTFDLTPPLAPATRRSAPRGAAPTRFRACAPGARSGGGARGAAGMRASERPGPARFETSWAQRLRDHLSLLCGASRPCASVRRITTSLQLASPSSHVRALRSASRASGSSPGCARASTDFTN